MLETKEVSINYENWHLLEGRNNRRECEVPSSFFIERKKVTQQLRQRSHL